MKRSEINQYMREAADFFAHNHFALPAWTAWSPDQWAAVRNRCDEVFANGLGWDLTDFGKGDFLKQGLTLITVRNGNVRRDNKTYCEKIMMVREGQVTPIHFHWKKMEDIINRGGGILCMKLWKANAAEERTDEPCRVQVDGITTDIEPGMVFPLRPGQSITYEPYMYHTFWGEGGDCMVGEVSTVNDDQNDNRFFEPLGRYPEIIEDEAPLYPLCNEYATLPGIK